jgi:hypothetical protein
MLMQQHTFRPYNIPLKEEAGLRQKVGTPERFCKSDPGPEHKLAITGAFCEERCLYEKLIILALPDGALRLPSSSSLSARGSIRCIVRPRNAYSPQFTLTASTWAEGDDAIRRDRPNEVTYRKKVLEKTLAKADNDFS